MNESKILARFDALVRSGLVLYDEDQTTVEYIDDGLKFQFLLTSALAHKPTLETTTEVAATPIDHETFRAGSDISTGDYELGNVGSTHFLAANKFCYARPHLMLLTSDGHRRQHEALDEADLSAAWSVLDSLEGEYVMIFNCGRDSGCSRIHKHMQIMPKPEKSFASFLDDEEDEEPNVPFYWFWRRFTSGLSVNSLVQVYIELLEQATRVAKFQSTRNSVQGVERVSPHNLILAKTWMIVIPRRRNGINAEAGANAMGMLGVIAVATQNEIQNWVALGLKTSLGELGACR